MTESEAKSKIKHRISVIREIAGSDSKSVEDLEIAVQVLKEIREYRELGTVEEFKFMKDNERKCEDCAGCTNWLCDCANERAKAIDEFTGMAYKMLGASDKDLYCSDIIDKIAEQMKGGATDEC